MEASCIIKNALENAIDQISASKQLSDQTINILIQLFGDMTVSAFSILDNEGVTKFCSPSNSSVYQVIGSNENIYTCLKEESYCNCLSFQNNNILKGSHFLCKHLLAVLVSSALGTAKIVPSTEQTINILLSFDTMHFDNI